MTLLKRRRPFREYTLHLVIFFSLSILLTSWFLPHVIFGESHTNEWFSDPLFAFRQEHENFPITSSIFDVEWIGHHLIRSLPSLYIFYPPWNSLCHTIFCWKAKDCRVQAHRDLLEPVFAGNLIDVYKSRYFNDQKISVLGTEAGRENELDNSQSEQKNRLEGT